MDLSAIRTAIEEQYAYKFGTLLFLTFLLTGVVGASIYGTVDDRLNSETRQELTSTARGEADQVDNWFDRTDREIDSMRRTTAFRSGDRFQIGDRLVRLSNRDAITGAYMVDISEGKAIVSTGDGQITTDDDRLSSGIESRITSTTATASGAVRHSDPFRLPDETPAMLVTARTPSRDGRTVVVVVDLPALSERLLGDGDTTDDGSTLSVIDQSGRVVLSDDHSEILTREPTADRLNESENATGFYPHPVAGGTAVGYADIRDRNWTVSQRLPAEEAYALRNAVADRILALLVVLLLGLGVVGVTIGRNTVATLSDLESKANRLDVGHLETPIETTREDEFGSVYESLDQMRRSLKSKIDAIEAERERVENAKATVQEARAEAEAAHQESAALAATLEDRAQEFGETMARAADGDLTQRLDTDLDTDAMADVAMAFNQMIAQLEVAITEIQSFTTNVNDATARVNSGSNAIQRASRRVDQSIAEISAGASEQDEYLHHIDEETSELSATIEEIAGSSDQVAALSQRAAERGHTGRELAARSVSTMCRIEKQTKNTVAEIDRLEAEIERVGEIATLIEEIAEQTNLLALNASIEAERSGDAGDSFVVVADEIKRLAAEVHEATDEIDDIVTRVRGTATEAASEMRETQELVDEGTEDIENGLTEIDEIVDLVEEVDDGVQSIDRVTDEQAASTQEVQTMVADVADRSSETAETAVDVSEAASEQMAVAATIAEDAQTLTERANRLQTTVAGFEVTSPSESNDPVESPTTIAPLDDGSSESDAKSDTETLDAGIPEERLGAATEEET